MNKPVIINLFGAPGSGKSTGAAYIFSQLKLRGINVEYITEFAKEMTWQHNQKALDDQVYMLGEAYHKIFVCQDQVDVIILDSPILLALLYNKDPFLGEPFAQLVINLHKRFDNINFFIDRVKTYNPAGRSQTEQESDQVRRSLLKLLSDIDETNYIEINGDEQGYNRALELIWQGLIDRGVAKSSSTNGANIDG